MADREKILAALPKLDPKNDNHWTMAGEAKLDTIKFLSGGEVVTRDELNALAPGFNREALRQHLASQQPQEGADVKQGASPAAGTGDGNGNGTVTVEAPKPPEVGSADREAEVEALAAEIADTNEEIQQCQRVQAEMSERIAVLQDRQQKLGAELGKIKPPKTPMQNIQDYLASVKKANKIRSQARATVVSSGLDLAQLQAALEPSPIDVALKNRPRRPAR